MIRGLAQQMISSFASALGWRAASMLPPWLVWVVFCVSVVIVAGSPW
jgi:hypothetical protein